jgi:hypothetical protein
MKLTLIAASLTALVFGLAWAVVVPGATAGGRRCRRRRKAAVAPPAPRMRKPMNTPTLIAATLTALVFAATPAIAPGTTAQAKPIMVADCGTAKG